jgi:hypothetical protein
MAAARATLVERNAGTDLDRSGVNVAPNRCVPAFLGDVWRSAASEGGHAPSKRAPIGQATSDQKWERKTNRRVAAVLRGLDEIKRESLIFKGFKEHRTQHEIFGKEQRRTARNPLFAGLSGGALGEHLTHQL